ncbi:MAG: orotidine-5'-phosphate decarboxylase [Candidatus Micrarchaeota archaeon]|nr:orotidine-5'-phosphate decarboxylase [Candidatus Micrarchaeota archaeon]
MASYLQLLRDSAKERNSIVCFGLDPDLAQLPESTAMLPREERIVQFYSSIIDAALNEKQSISALKPNYAYFAQYGWDGLRALKTLIERYKGKLPIIFDGKRGDIGKSSEAYANEAFNFWMADSLTVSPYMGADSVSPFLERCKDGRGVYVLCRTSNAGAADFQSLNLDKGKQLFMEVAQKLSNWHTQGMGAVLGATALDELEQVLWIFYDSHKELPLLIPGVGAQGASAAGTAKILRSVWIDAMPLHRINSSSAIAYAYKKAGNEDYVGAALSEIKRMNEEIGRI